MSSREIYEQTFDEDVQQRAINTCPECDGHVATNTHETVCDDCGLILDDERIDRGPEWRRFEDRETTPKRTGAPNTIARHDRGIGSDIGWSHEADNRTRKRLSRLRREHNRSKFSSKAERNRAQAFVDIRRMVSALGLSYSVRDQACQLFRTAQDEGLLPGRSIESITAGCLYAVCRLNKHPRTFAEVASVSKLPVDRIRNGYSVLNRELELPIPPASPREYLPQIASGVDADAETERVAREILDRESEKLDSNGCHPCGVAAGALYLAGQSTGAYLRQNELAEVADVSAMTVRERYRDLGGESA